jgi:putative alpha-1,2-mannosidase
MAVRKQTRFPVDPFIGSEPTALPLDTGLPSGWQATHPQIGNTHPGASMPFGIVSACAYTGGFPTGYSLYTHTNQPTPTRFQRERAIRGITHIHPSGTHTTGHYYNFLRLTPLTTQLADRERPTPLSQEEAAPGYYSYTREHDHVHAEVTTSRFAAVHRYTFPPSAHTRLLALNVTQSGLDAADEDRFHIPASTCRLSVAEDGSAGGVAWFAGLPLFFALHISSGSTQIWCENAPIDATDLMLEEPISGVDAGLLITPDHDQIDISIAFSFTSIESAINHLKRTVSLGFDRVARRAGAAWNRHLSSIQVDGSEDDTRLFYSLFHHALRKPTELTGNGPLGDFEHYTEFASLAHQRRTHLPLIMSLFPERGTKIVNSLLSLAECYDGHFPAGHLLAELDSQRDCFANEANSQAHLVIYDAFVRQLPGINWARAVWLMHRSLQAEDPALRRGESPSPSHIIDLAHGAWCTWRIARQIGEHAIAEKCKRLAPVWHMAYDTATGLLLKHGSDTTRSPWPASFRLHPYMAERMALLGTRAAATATLDRFFGYGAFPNPMHDRFHGLNAPSGIDAPYLYHWLNRPDRTAEIVAAAMDQCFAPTRGGLPGNEHAGTLASWYIWNAIGIYPMSGQSGFLLGSPRFDAADIRLGTGRLEVRCQREHPDAIYVTSASLNGHPIDNGRLKWEDIQDSRIELTLSRQPN